MVAGFLALFAIASLTACQRDVDGPFPSQTDRVSVRSFEGPGGSLIYVMEPDGVVTVYWTTGPQQIPGIRQDQALRSYAEIVALARSEISSLRGLDGMDCPDYGGDSIEIWEAGALVAEARALCPQAEFQDAQARLRGAMFGETE